MNSYYTIKQWLKLVRWQYRRAIVDLRWGSKNLKSAPTVLGNAMPKSGSHLIIQVLQGLTKLGPLVNPGFPPVNRGEDNSKLDEAAILANIERMRPGDIGYGYISAKEPYVTYLTQPGRATIFVYRDPRDMIVSHIFYATHMHKDHWMHKYYTEELHTMEERINAAIVGVEKQGSELTPIRKRYEVYIGWLEKSKVLSLQFEHLIRDRDTVIGNLLDYLQQRGFTYKISRSEAIDTIKQAINPKKSGTFRKGKPGNWQEHFTETNKTLFKEHTGDLLIHLGYEVNQSW